MPGDLVSALADLKEQEAIGIVQDRLSAADEPFWAQTAKCEPN